jgi:thiol-disulfide isomerase/thioredoxin
MVTTGEMRLVAPIFGLLLGALQLLSGQSWLIQGTIENAEEGSVVLSSYDGEHFRVVDSIGTRSGFFYFMLPEYAPPGIYRIGYMERRDEEASQERFVGFIFNREQIELFVASTGQDPLPYFEGSLENQVYTGFTHFERAYKTEMKSLRGQLYPPRVGEEDLAAVIGRYNNLQEERIRYMDSITLRYPDLYAVRLMNAFRAPMIPGELSHSERIDTLKHAFFDYAAIDDPRLLFAPVYIDKLIEYLSLYKEDGLTKELQEQQFIEAVDRIMVNVSGNEVLRSFVVESLLEKFERLDMEQVQVHLADHYLDQACVSDIVDLILSRMEGNKEMAEGVRAPDFVIRDAEGRNQRLSDLATPYVLVMFWASSCDHCQVMMPELHAWYLSENRIGLEVVAISIDTSVADYRRFVEELNPQWITSRDPLGWHGKVPSEYHIYATPSLFLLDGDRTILARPTTFRQFQRAIRKLLTN